ncbi:hypothetical protein OCS65_28300 (plasmid) [Rhodococcus aetherivorans]|uniref:Uncharacterized protein n=1 Tax=Rhodococcus aetherivorans TaxID=191292 RepID=A0AA46SCK4_9NOCA|nr:hypothetical protein [Rhodococcus aetherivorans]UYF97128.1 hypothetical protein OCS65_28300 [Rhodococcus aetherivorans]
MDEIANWGALLFGFVVGWITYRTLARRSGGTELSDIASVIGAVGGAVVTGLFINEERFSYYSIGLFAGFFIYLIVFWHLNGQQKTSVVMGQDGLSSGTERIGGGGR